jgi:hypothetical protein
MKALLFMSLLASLLASCSTVKKDRWNVSLQESLAGVTRLRVRSGGTCDGEAAEAATLLTMTNAEHVTAIARGLRINVTNIAFHCMCCGGPTLEFYRNKEMAASLSLHHGRSLRWSDGKWDGDGLMEEESASALLRQLADCGLVAPLKEYEEDARREEHSQRSRRRWEESMPSAIKPFWNQPIINQLFGESDVDAMNDALAQEFPEEQSRILALLNWFGSGEGPWSGYPAYEADAEQLLLMHSTAAILAAIQGVSLNEGQTEGLARLLGGWNFSQQRPEDLSLLPGGLKSKLLQHSIRTDNNDKRERAVRAFGGEVK